VSSKPLGKLARKRTAQATAAQKFADVYKMLGMLSTATEREVNELDARLAVLEAKEAKREAAKRPWWRVWR
jgi:hypothetical protein